VPATTVAHCVAVIAKQKLARVISVAALIPNNAHMSRPLTCLTTSGPHLLRSHKLQVSVDYRSARSAAPLVPLYECPYLHSSGILVWIFKVIGGGHLNMPLDYYLNCLRAIGMLMEDTSL